MSGNSLPERAAAALQSARTHLLEERTEAGHWEGELSTSALSTATALVALGSVDETGYSAEIERASDWLVQNRNEDGGWGDTDRSFSNISTTLLCWSALTRFGGEKANPAVREATHWIRDYVGLLDPHLIAETVKARYGKDRTFSVPILMLCAICGTLGRNGWRHVQRLPYELSIFPRSWFAAMRLPVVSYALPALIAIGRAKDCQWWRANPAWPRASELLKTIQPASGGFLEAAPLTSFVTMALVAAGEKEHPVAKKGVEFLLDTVREDGSWPIDTNLATWATTLSVKALSEQSTGWNHPSDPAGSEEGVAEDGNLPTEPKGISASFPATTELCQVPLPLPEAERILEWLLGQQYREVHPFTNSPPGGWAWTDLTGGVPDADDTPGALLAIAKLRTPDREREILSAAESAIGWLLDLQNRDGGIPTFCRGWGALPFDRSSPDLTAHTLRAWNEWAPEMPGAISRRITTGREKALCYLQRRQRPDGSWVPLWFGNQHRFKDEENPTYGTSMVVRALEEIGEREMAEGGVSWLVSQQNPDGGWGAGAGITPSTVEETALAISALAGPCGNGFPRVFSTLEKGVRALLRMTEDGTRFPSAPIGFYFARLWYYERIYPLVWTVEALGRFCARSGLSSPPDSSTIP